MAYIAIRREQHRADDAHPRAAEQRDNAAARPSPALAHRLQNIALGAPIQRAVRRRTGLTDAPLSPADATTRIGTDDAFTLLREELTKTGHGQDAVLKAIQTMETEATVYYIEEPAFLNRLRQVLGLASSSSVGPSAAASPSLLAPSLPRASPRTRPRHHLSDGESENDDPDIAWRALRDEEEPLLEGLQPPPGHDPTKTASAHIAAGSKAAVKSAWVSASRSRKPATAWGTTTQGRKRVAKVRISGTMRASRVLGGRGYYDLTDPGHAAEVFPSGGTALNAAKASQEVVAHGGIPPQDVLEIYDVVNVSIEEYTRIKAALATGGGAMYGTRRVYAAFRTRAKTGDPPLARVMLKKPVPNLVLMRAIRKIFPGAPIDDHLIAWVQTQSDDLDEQLFLYEDIYRTMHEESEIDSGDEADDEEDEDDDGGDE